MTSVAGHLTSTEFHERFRKWAECNPSDLFEAPLVNYVEQVCSCKLIHDHMG